MSLEKFYKVQISKSHLGRALAQAVIPRPLTAEARVRSRVSSCGICVVNKVALGQFFTRALQFFPVNFIPLVLHYKEKKLIIFLTGLHNKPQGCGALLHKKNLKGWKNNNDKQNGAKSEFTIGDYFKDFGIS
jgi:hypothetical protein